ncbi:DNA mismatch repair endonuclease MutL, partial [Myxococcota bacterium]|nr:DNA mismatch repair endonuclease MutL [Myxococcota bacterium]
MSTVENSGSITSIVLLPDNVINQIAAGEVVERPASVVKELVENSIDAGADHIEITIEKGGTALISIGDNGRGIRPEQIPTALKRHATSKISSVDDLQTITTFGFRGEALPSVASVSRLRISSRTAAEEVATYLLLDGGKELRRGEEVQGIGTKILVQDLFHKLPARQKFQKSEQTETAHIHDTIIKFSLAHYRVHFTFYNQGRMVLDFPPHQSLL